MAVLIEFEGKRPRVASTAFVAHTAVLLGDVEVAENASIWFGAVLRGDFGPIRIGPGCNVQDNVVIHAETGQGTVLQERVTVGHGAILHDCWIGKDSLIGMGAILLDRSRIGTGSLVGAGSVVKERFEVPDGTLAVGNPAINKKKLEGNSADWVARGADDYLRLIKRYADSSRVL
jgi:carbonic anhydrase/acetyltransferase-like protein (isoleucine patch superfamily)